MQKDAERMSRADEFAAERRQAIREMDGDGTLRALSRDWFLQSSRHKYSYNFTWLGRPIIQLPQDILAMQEIIWAVQPDLIVETGVAHGGSLMLYASLLELIGANGLVLGIDIDIRAHNRAEIEAHPLFKRIALLEGSSVSESVCRQVGAFAEGRKRVLVVLDSHHTHAHVLRELELYSPLVTKGSYLVVFDTIVEDMPEDAFPDRPWGRGNNPHTAVQEFLQTNTRFAIDADMDAKLLISVAPKGYLKCIQD